MIKVGAAPGLAPRLRRSDHFRDCPQPFTGFPVELGGFGKLHAPFFTERRTRSSLQCSVAGNPGPLGMTKGRGTLPFGVMVIMTTTQMLFIPLVTCRRQFRLVLMNKPGLAAELDARRGNSRSLHYAPPDFLRRAEANPGGMPKAL